MSRRSKREILRDQGESAFTPLFRRFLDAEPHAASVIFVDRDGECVDYATTTDPFETKVLGAHLQSVVGTVRSALKRLSAGETISVVVYGETLDFVVRRLDDEYSLVVAIRAPMTDDTVLAAIEALVLRLRAAARLDAPWWDVGADGLDVQIRAAVGWGFAPEAVIHEGIRYEVQDVLGRWDDDGGLPGGPLALFQVRMVGAKELTLAYDALAMRWWVW